jgi:hypothetical protein
MNSVIPDLLEECFELGNAHGKRLNAGVYALVVCQAGAEVNGTAEEGTAPAPMVRTGIARETASIRTDRAEYYVDGARSGTTN